jgi:hypothetical protein
MTMALYPQKDGHNQSVTGIEASAGGCCRGARDNGRTKNMLNNVRYSAPGRRRYAF